MEPASFLMYRDNNMLNGIESKHARDEPKQTETATKTEQPHVEKATPPPSDLTQLNRHELLALTKHAQARLGETRDPKKGKGKKGGKGGKKK